MKITTKEGKVFEGEPDDLARYFKSMTWRRPKKVKKETTSPEGQIDLLDDRASSRGGVDWDKAPKIRKRTVRAGTSFSRALWNNYENAFICEKHSQGWGPSKIVKALNRQGISPIRRTAPAVTKQLIRLSFQTNPSFIYQPPTY